MIENEIKIERTAKFNREFKKLKKKYLTLDDDFQVFINFSLKRFVIEKQNLGIVRISGTGIDYPPFYKVKHFSCKSIFGKGSRSGFRIIFFIHDEIYQFIEIYIKSNKENHDKARIEEIVKMFNDSN